MGLRVRNSLTVLKLGGSVITHKDLEASFNDEAMERLAGEIYEASVKPMIIVHGGGSFGHPVAKRYRLVEGVRGLERLIGVVETRLSMEVLNREVVKALTRRGVLAVSMHPSSFIIAHGGRVKHIDLTVLRMALKIGLMPVLYGDVVFDEVLGASIISGDQIASYLAVKFRAWRLIFGVDVDGLYTADPKKFKEARLLESITLRELKDYFEAVEGSSPTDVTGGMYGKILELMEAVEAGVMALVLNASKPGLLKKALLGERVIGTYIHP